MTRVGLCGALVLAGASMMAAQAAAPQRALRPRPRRLARGPGLPSAPDLSEILLRVPRHDKPKAGSASNVWSGSPLSLRSADIGRSGNKIAEMLETRQMPPDEAKLFPTDDERAAAVAWIRTSLKDV